MFHDRSDAGKRLGKALKGYRRGNALICAIPRGGVEVGFHVAMDLEAELTVIVSRKLPLPFSPESGFGAIAEDGSIFLCPGFDSMVPPDEVKRIIMQQRREMKRRISVLREGKPLPSMKRRTVILVDDGIAMGSTMRVSIELCKNREAGSIVVAVPVTGRETAMQIGQLVDEIVVLEMPEEFRAVAQVYRHWYDVSDKEVLVLMKKWREEHP